MLGDGVWEGLRLHRGVLLFAERHLRRLFEGAKAIDMDLGACAAHRARSFVCQQDIMDFMRCTIGFRFHAPGP